MSSGPAICFINKETYVGDLNSLTIALAHLNLLPRQTLLLHPVLTVITVWVSSQQALINLFFVLLFNLILSLSCLLIPGSVFQAVW